MRLPPLPTLREIIHLLDLRAQKQLSQNFLLEPRLLKSIVKCAAPSLKGACVMEIGPGPGGLTREILQHGPPCRLALVELDRRFIPGLELLQTTVAPQKVSVDIYRQDIMKFNTDGIFPELLPSTESSADAVEASPLPLHVIANLPFNLSTALLIKMLHDISESRGMWRHAAKEHSCLTLMFQEEVGERMVAEPWSEQRSRLSIMCQAICETKMKNVISGSAFLPKAKVNAVVMRLQPLKQPLIPVPFPYLEKFVRAIFHHRQKNIIYGIETLFPPTQPHLILKIFKESDILPTVKPTELSMSDFAQLCTTYKKICDEHPGVFEFEYRDRKESLPFRRRKAVQRELFDDETLNSQYVRKYVLKEEEVLVKS